jgi:hypothetical protein
MPLPLARIAIASYALLGTFAAAAAAHEPAERPGGPGEHARQPRELTAMVRRMDRYFVEHAVDGVTLDSRFDINPPEAIRQSVVCQLLGYVELEALHPRRRFVDAMAGDADYLIAHLAVVRSHTPFDGMLGYSLLAAYEVTREPRHLEAARAVVDEMLAIPTEQCILNGGLMVALATAKDAALFGSAGSDAKSRAILAQLARFQNPDGSFPHWCFGSRDIHYTGWMAHELIHLERMTGDARIPPLLARMGVFMEGRIGPDGRSIYEQPCDAYPGCTEAYYSRATGCGYDYDTRGWTVEPGYQTLLFDHLHSPQLRPVFRFLRSLEKGGTFPDLYGYWPPTDDPEYPWTIADTSVANMSIIFWSLATALRDRNDVLDATLAWGDDPAAPPAPPPPPSVDPRPADPSPPPPPHPVVDSPPIGPGEHEIRFTLEQPADVRLRVIDIGGRLVREITAGAMPAGTHVLVWDERDGAGGRAPSGVYFADLRTSGDEWRMRWIVCR